MKYHKLVENAHKPKGFWGKLMIRSMNKNHSQLTDWALSHIQIKRSSNILDVGCGGGRTVDKLSRAVGNGKVYGIDYSELCVKKASKLNEKNIMCGKTKIYRASVSELPFDDCVMDVVTAIETYYFWPDKLNDLIEIRRTLKPNGILMLVFEMLKTDDEPDKWAEVEQTANIKAVTKDEITDILLHAGYINIKSYKKSGTSWLCVTAEKE